ncbi:MAG: hypothetical protein N3F07_01415 [Candidatus Micrarchaeota archaeon]|nr:hypothetical protein [Candidatus Micrarchaeota archaeon]
MLIVAMPAARLQAFDFGKGCNLFEVGLDGKHGFLPGFAGKQSPALMPRLAASCNHNLEAVSLVLRR